MSELTVGDVVTLDYALTNTAGAPTAATVTLAVTSPSGVASSPAPSNPSTGTYSADVPVTAAGVWTYVWTATGTATDTTAGEFTVENSVATDDLRLLRLLINDLATPRTFVNSELQRLLTLEGAVKLAAAQALDIIASNEALVLKRITTLDLQTDGPAVAKALREHAAALRAQAAAAVTTTADAAAGDFEFTTGMGTPTWPHGAGELTETGWWG